MGITSHPPFCYAGRSPFAPNRRHVRAILTDHRATPFASNTRLVAREGVRRPTPMRFFAPQ
jgi:hypothetical protein